MASNLVNENSIGERDDRFFNGEIWTTQLTPREVRVYRDLVLLL